MPGRLRMVIAAPIAALLLGVATASSAFDLRAEIERAMAVTDSLRRSEGTEAARAHLVDLHGRAVAADDSLARLDVLRLQSFWWRKLGDLEGGIDRGMQALALAEALRDTSRMCSEIYKLGLAEMQRGDLETADARFERVLTLAHLRGDRAYEARARTALGRRALFAGRLDDAQDHLEWAVAITAHESMEHDQVLALNLLGILWSNRARYGQARACFDRCLELSEELDYPYGISQATSNLAYLENHLGDPGRAAEGHRRALELARRMGQPSAAINAGSNLASSLVQLGRLEEAQALLEELLADARQRGYAELECSVRIHLAACLQERGRSAASIEHLEEAIALARDAQYVEGEVRAADRLARAFRVEDREAEALRRLGESMIRLTEIAPPTQALHLAATHGELLLAVGDGEAARRRLAEADERARKADLRGPRLALLSGLARAELALDRPDSARAALERAVVVWERERSLPRDPEWRAQRGSLGRRVHTELAALRLHHPPTEAFEARVRRAYDGLRRYKARVLLETMTGPADEVPAGPSVDLAALQEQVLDEGELLLDAYLGPDVSLVFAITRADCRVVELPSDAELEPRLLRYARMLAEPTTDPQSVEESAGVLGRLLFGGFGEQLASARRVLFAADGVLHRIPVAGLLASAVPAFDAPSSRIPSASVLARLRVEAADREVADAIDVVAVAGGRDARGRPLPGARAEIARLRGRFRHVDVYENEAPGAEALARGRVLHLAAHTRVDPERPWQSGLLLAAGEPGYLQEVVARVPDAPSSRRAASRTERARYLQASEIAGLSLGARLAVLSGCDSAGGRILSGEGVQGLATAFLRARVGAVVATLWPVDDGSTVRFMERFYEALADHESVESALRVAQDHLRNGPETRHPFYWAGFVVIGDGERRVPLQRRGTTREVWPWIAILAVVGVGLWSRSRFPARK